MIKDRLFDQFAVRLAGLVGLVVFAAIFVAIPCISVLFFFVLSFHTLFPIKKWTSSKVKVRNIFLFIFSLLTVSGIIPTLKCALTTFFDSCLVLYTSELLPNDFHFINVFSLARKSVPRSIYLLYNVVWYCIRLSYC